MHTPRIIPLGNHHFAYIGPYYLLRPEGELSRDETLGVVEELFRYSQEGKFLGALLFDAARFSHVGSEARQAVVEHVRTTGTIYATAFLGMSFRSKVLIGLIMQGMTLLTGHQRLTKWVDREADGVAWLLEQHANHRPPPG